MPGPKRLFNNRAEVIVFAVAMMIVALVGLFVAYARLVPVNVVDVPVPVPSVRLSRQLYGSFETDGSHWMTVSNEHGKLVEHLFEDWGPAQRSNYYITPEGWLAVLGAGDLVALVELPSDGPPRPVPWSERSAEDEESSESWRYIGAVDGFKPTKYISPTVTECVQSFGLAEIYRKKHVGGGCSPQDIARLEKSSAVDPRQEAGDNRD